MSIVRPYVDGASPEQERIAALIRTRRGGHLMNLDRVLLLSAPFAEGFNALMPKVRNELTLTPRLRELVICAVASLTGAQYELHHHTPLFLASGGTPAQLDALTRLGLANFAAARGDFSDADEAILAFTVESTRLVRVAESTSHAVKEHLGNDQQVMELVALIAAYNMVCRIVVNLGVEVERV